MYRELSTLGKECQRQLLDMAQAATEQMSKLREQHGKLETSQNNIQSDFTKAREELRLKADDNRGLVTRQEDCLLKQLCESKEKALASVRAANEKTRLNIALTESLLSNIQVLQVSGNVFDLVVLTPGLQQQLKHQQGMEEMGKVAVFPPWERWK